MLHMPSLKYYIYTNNYKPTCPTEKEWKSLIFSFYTPTSLSYKILIAFQLNINATCNKTNWKLHLLVFVTANETNSSVAIKDMILWAGEGGEKTNLQRGH